MLLVVAFPNTQNIVGETWTATGKPFVIHVATSSCRVCAIIAWTCVNVCQIVKNLDWTDAISNTFKMGTIEVKGLLAVDQDRSFLLAKVMVAHWGISFFNYNTTVIMCAGICRKYRYVSCLDNKCALGYQWTWLFDNVGASKLITTVLELWRFITVTVLSSTFWTRSFTTLGRSGSWLQNWI